MLQAGSHGQEELESHLNCGHSLPTIVAAFLGNIEGGRGGGV